MRNPGWKRIEAGIWLVSKVPRIYWVEVRKDNSRKKACKKVFGSIHDARRVKNELWVRLEQRSLKSKGYYTHIWRALGYYIHKHYSGTAQYRYGSGRAIMRFWMIRIGRLVPLALQGTHINKTIHDMKGDGFKASGIIPYVSRLKTALLFAKQAGKIQLSDGVFDNLVKLRPERTPRLSISDEDVDRIFAGIPDWGRPVIIYKRLVPCRLLELYSAKTETLDLEQNSFILTENKNGVPREMPIPEIMLSYFEYAKSCGSEWVFFREEVNKKGKTVYKRLSRNHLTKLFSAARDALNLDKRIVLRLLRHTTVRKWLRNFDESLVGSVAGASPETLQKHYDLVEIGSKVEAANRIAEMHRFDNENLVVFKKRVG